MFKVGEKVVCIDDSPFYSDNITSSELKKGDIYILSMITRGGVGCYIKELKPEFYLRRFKPLDYDFVEELLLKLKEELV